MNLSNCKIITINNKDVAKIEINNKIAWQKAREKKRIIDGNNFNVLVKNINGSGSTISTDDTTITKIVFDYWSSSYQTLLGNYTNGTDVSFDNDGSIRLFYDNTIIYVLSVYNISVQNASSMFRAFTVMTEIDFYNFNTEDCTDFSFFLWNCSSLTTQHGMEEFDTSKCTTMERMLSNISIATIGQNNNYGINVSGWDTTKVETMGHMFRDNKATYIDISSFYTPVCDRFRAMFSGCTNLVTLNMENIDMSLCTCNDSGNAKNFAYGIDNCSNLTNLVFSKNLGSGYPSNRALFFASIKLSGSPLLTRESILSVFNNIGTIPGGSMVACYIYMGSTYDTVTSADIVKATQKNWLVSNSSS